MLFLFRNWKRRRELKKLYETLIHWKEVHEELLKKADVIEEHTNKRLRELEKKLNQLEQQFGIFEKLIESLDPKNRVN